MDELVAISLIGEVLLPGALAVRLLRCPGARGAHLAACAAYGGMLWTVGVWQLFPRSLLVLWGLLQAGAAILSRRRPEQPPGVGRASLRPHPATLSSLLIAVVSTAVFLFARFAPAPPEAETVDLDSPLRGGTFRVVHGGFSILINPHLKTLSSEALAPHRGQAYALDIVRVDPLGRRARGLRPGDPRDYFIFWLPVFAPCGGTVIASRSGMPDRSPPRMDPDPPEGNFVRLDCGGFEVVVAHLAQSSPSVAPGDRVAAGAFLGRVGNSGMSLEPHLHLHAERREEGGSRPVAVRIGGRRLVRNDLFSPQ
ncbi:MAG: M23 family metallopeptidase [Desulfobacterales bacterium]